MPDAPKGRSGPQAPKQQQWPSGSHELWTPSAGTGGVLNLLASLVNGSTGWVSETPTGGIEWVDKGLMSRHLAGIRSEHSPPPPPWRCEFEQL